MNSFEKLSLQLQEVFNQLQEAVQRLQKAAKQQREATRRLQESTQRLRDTVAGHQNKTQTPKISVPHTTLWLPNKEPPKA